MLHSFMGMVFMYFLQLHSSGLFFFFFFSCCYFERGIDIGRLWRWCAYDRAIRIGCQTMGNWFLLSEGEEKWIVAGCLVDWRPGQVYYHAPGLSSFPCSQSEPNFLTCTIHIRLTLNQRWLFFVHHFQKPSMSWVKSDCL